MDMKAQWQGWAQQIAALSLRERILILLTGVVLLGAMGIYGWLDDADTRLGQDLQIPLRRSQGLPILVQPGVETTLRQMDAELLAQTVDLIPAHEMPAVLEALLSRSANLHMLALTSLKPEPLMAGEQKVNLFRHGIQLQLEGGYFDVYQYLKALEALPRHFYWKGFDYRVVEHPKAAVAMEIYTLSTSKEFIRG